MIFSTFFNTTFQDLGVDLTEYPNLFSWWKKMQNIPGNDVNKAGAKAICDVLGIKSKL